MYESFELHQKEMQLKWHTREFVKLVAFEMPDSLLLCAFHFHSCISFHLQNSHPANLKFVKSNATSISNELQLVQTLCIRPRPSIWNKLSSCGSFRLWPDASGSRNLLVAPSAQYSANRGRQNETFWRPVTLRLKRVTQSFKNRLRGNAPHYWPVYATYFPRVSTSILQYTTPEMQRKQERN